VTDLKEYYISEIGYKGPFGTKDVLRAKSENGNNRFYVMALEDVDNNTYGYWDAQNKVNGEMKQPINMTVQAGSAG